MALVDPPTAPHSALPDGQCLFQKSKAASSWLETGPVPNISHPSYQVPSKIAAIGSQFRIDSIELVEVRGHEEQSETVDNQQS